MKALMLAGLLSAATGAAQAGDIEMRFCPAGVVRTYPLSDMRHLDSLLLQNVAVLNHGSVPVTIDEVEVQLLKGGVVQDERHIAGDALKSMAQAGPAIEGGGMLQLVPFQFCGTDMVAPSVKLGGPALAPGEGLLVIQQAFAFRGAPDTLRVVAHMMQNGKDATARGDISISAGFAKNHYIFPLKGVWYAGVGPTFHSGHRWTPPEEFGFDIAKIGATGLTHKGDGTHFSDYYAYGADVLAAADGKVIAAVNDQGEDLNAMRQPGETQTGYFERLQQDQAERLTKGVAGLAGNYVMIDHGGGEYSLYAHLQPRSVHVQPGDTVKAGEIIGRLGSSGNATEPHLHFQVCDKPDPLMCAGIPVQFTNIEIPFADLPRAVQSGDIVIAK